MPEHSEVLPETLPAEPLAIVAAWLEEAWAARRQPNPNAMVLATASSAAQPSARVVLCKDIVPQPGYVVFYTNYLSTKGRQLKDNPRAAAVMHWDALHRQVRIEGPVSLRARGGQRRLLRLARLAEPRRRLGERAERAGRLARRAARGGAGDGAALRRADARLAGCRRLDAGRDPAAAALGRLAACGRRAWSCGSRARPASTTAPAGAGAHGPRRWLRRRAVDGDAPAALRRPRRVWKTIRIGVLLIVLGGRGAVRLARPRTSPRAGTTRCGSGSTR